MSNRLAIFLGTMSLLGIMSLPAMAQLVPVNDAGVTMGHVHLLVKDVDLHKQIFGVLGGKVIKNGPLELIEIPGAFVMLRKGEPGGGSAGTVLNHFGVNVKDLQDTLAKLKPMTSESQKGNLPGQVTVTVTDGIRIELIEDKTLTTTSRMHHVHWVVQKPLEAQAFYAKLTGAVPGKRSRFETAMLPGVELAFIDGEPGLAPTKGRVFDHVGFDVRNLEEFAKRLEAQGLKYDAPIRQIPGAKTRVAFFTDPWGAYVEISENLAPPHQH